MIFAGLILGPHRIRQVMRKLGEYTAQFQQISRSFRQQLNQELDNLESQDLKEAMQEMQNLRSELADLKQQVSAIPQDLANQGQEAIDEAQAILNENGTTANGSKAPLPNLVEVEDDPDS